MFGEILSDKKQKNNKEEYPDDKSKMSNKCNDFSLSLDPDGTWRQIESSQEFCDVPTISSDESLWDRSRDCTRIVCMSDTHGLHRDVAIPAGDVLIHAGDFTSTGEVDTIRDMIKNFQEQQSNFSSTICIAGNHDMTFDLPYYQRSWRRFHKRQELDAPQVKQSMIQYMKDSSANNSNKFYYLEDSSCSIPMIGGGRDGSSSSSLLSVYGSPWSPEFYDWAFNVPRGEPSRKIWSKIPTETDILITHGPPLGRGDLCDHGGRAGCYDLLQQVQQRVQPRLMVFGHIHEGYGVEYDGTTMYVNASNLDVEYDNIHPCIVIDLPHDPTQPPRIVQPSSSRGPLAGGVGGGGHGEEKVDIVALCTWFRQNGYDILANVMEKSKCPNLPTGDEILQTPRAYKTISQQLRISTYKERKARKELRKALLQIHSESF